MNLLNLTQRQINHGVFGLTVGTSAVMLIVLLNAAFPWNVLVQVFIGLALSSALWAAYWSGWEQARYVLIIGFVLIIAIGTDDFFLRDRFNHVVYVAPTIALVLAGPIWVLASGLAVLVAFIYRIGAPYLNYVDLLAFVFIISGMVFSRLAIDDARRLEAARREAEAARALAEQRERDLAAQAAELRQRNAEQQRLLELVATLETPMIRLADGVLLAPIVGTLDERRAQALMTRLLQQASAQRAHRVILDVSGVPTVDTQVARALLNATRALELLGCHVVLTGISANVALTLTQLGIPLEGMTIVRSPQEALEGVSRENNI